MKGGGGIDSDRSQGRDSGGKGSRALMIPIPAAAEQQ